MSKWVQHISGQGEKWEVVESIHKEITNDYEVYGKTNSRHCGTHHWLPKSEYKECDPPEEWEDVSGECELNNDKSIYHKDYLRFDPFLSKGYRLRKVPVNFVGPGKAHGCEKGEAFIIERKKS